MKQKITTPVAALLIGLFVLIVLGVFWKTLAGNQVRVDDSSRPHSGRT